MRRSGKPGIVAGALVGAMLTAALIGVSYAAWQLAGLPFVPFDVFDWVSRVLPGRVIAFGISTMVAAIRALGVGPTSTAAKAAAQAMGITGLFFMGVVGGAVLFVVLRMKRGRFAYHLGLVLGLAVGIPVMLINLHLSHTTSVAPAIGGIAHAGARGISRVELQMDAGPWQGAQLRTPLSDLTWVLWRYDRPRSQDPASLISLPAHMSKNQADMFGCLDDVEETSTVWPRWHGIRRRQSSSARRMPDFT